MILRNNYFDMCIERSNITNNQISCSSQNHCLPLSLSQRVRSGRRQLQELLQEKQQYLGIYYNTESITVRSNCRRIYNIYHSRKSFHNKKQETTPRRQITQSSSLRAQVHLPRFTRRASRNWAAGRREIWKGSLSPSFSYTPTRSVGGNIAPFLSPRARSALFHSLFLLWCSSCSRYIYSVSRRRGFSFLYASVSIYTHLSAAARDEWSCVCPCPMLHLSERTEAIFIREIRICTKSTSWKVVAVARVIIY